MKSKKPITNKEERYRLAMSALHQIAKYKKTMRADDYDAYHGCKKIAINTLESFGKKIEHTDR